MKSLKLILRKIPFLRSLKRIIKNNEFSSSKDYWERRYERGGNSGPGSYNELSLFKAEVLNTFVQQNKVNNVIEFGCGDGNQLTLAEYPQYIGFDVSPKAISLCNAKFSSDRSKEFYITSEYNGQKAELTLSLDVIYHLVEDDVFIDYMNSLFSASNRFVIIYSSNTDINDTNRDAHLKNRKFTDWVEKNQDNWKLTNHLSNRYPYDGDPDHGSISDFYFYENV